MVLPAFLIGGLHGLRTDGGVGPGWEYAEASSYSSQLLRLDAAELDADVAAVTALATACRRRAAVLETGLDERFAEPDLLADSLKGG
jgi:hypothetical protein